MAEYEEEIFTRCNEALRLCPNATEDEAFKICFEAGYEYALDSLLSHLKKNK